MTINALCSKGAVELAAMIRDREVSSREVVDAHLERIAAINPTVNAVTTTLAVAARDAANLDGTQWPAAGGAAPEVVEQFAQREAEGAFDQPYEWPAARISHAIVPLPVPLVGATIVIQEFVVEAVHGQSAPGVLMANEFVAACAVWFRDTGTMSNSQSTPNCDTANDWPPITTTPERGSEVGFAATV